MASCIQNCYTHTSCCIFGSTVAWNQDILYNMEEAGAEVECGTGLRKIIPLLLCIKILLQFADSHSTYIINIIFTWTILCRSTDLSDTYKIKKDIPGARGNHKNSDSIGSTRSTRLSSCGCPGSGKAKIRDSYTCVYCDKYLLDERSMTRVDTDVVTQRSAETAIVSVIKG